jgi:hypothetical protein
MELIPLKTVSGEQRAWEALLAAAPEDICRRAEAVYDPAAGAFRVPAFGMQLTVVPGERAVLGADPGSAVLLRNLRDLFVPALLVYLTTARDLPPTGRLVSPGNIRGGHLFSSGTHVLPLDRVARKFGRDREGFLARGRALGGEPAPLGDAAVRLLPLPRVPAHVVLWLEDDEFPARADLLLDSSCELQAAADVLWALATATVLLVPGLP